MYKRKLSNIKDNFSTQIDDLKEKLIRMRYERCDIQNDVAINQDTLNTLKDKINESILKKDDLIYEISQLQTDKTNQDKEIKQLKLEINNLDKEKVISKKSSPIGVS